MAPRLVIFDLDNTLYREPPALSQACAVAMARAAADIVPGMTYENALELALESNRKTGSVAAPFFEKYSLSHTDLHERYHNYVDHLILPQCENTKTAFAKINRDKTMLGILTHSSRGWAQRVLNHLGLEEFFDPDLIVPFEEPGYHYKHDSEIPFLHLMVKAAKKYGSDIDVADIVMVEDVEKNLVVPYKMGMQTVLIMHGREPGEWPFVHQQYENVPVLIRSILT